MRGVGIVVGTFGTPLYVECQAASRRVLYPDVPMMVYDDRPPSGDAETERVNEVCIEHGLPLVRSSQSFGHFCGDLKVFTSGLKWADSLGLDWLIKLSRRFVPVVDISAELESAISENPDHHVFSTYDNGWGLPCRTECIAIRVRPWIDYALWDMEQLAKTRSQGVFVEGFFGDRSRIITGIERGLGKDIPDDPEGFGFGRWESFMGRDRKEANPKFLWHETSSEVDYQRHLSVMKTLSSKVRPI